VTRATDRRRHQGRKPGTVVPVRKAGERRGSQGDLRPFSCVSRRRRDTQGTSYRNIVGPHGLRTFEGVEPMGRGRAKAKQVKVARQLKYKSDDTDLDRLRAELGVGADSGDGNSATGDYDDDEEEDDESPGSEDVWKDAEDAWPR
jgi:hypothetical protein